MPQENEDANLPQKDDSICKPVSADLDVDAAANVTTANAAIANAATANAAIATARAAVRGFVGALFLTAGPMVAAHRGLNNFMDHWQELALYAVASLAGLLIASRLTYVQARSHRVHVPDKKERYTATGGFVFVFLFIACSALCERLQLGAFPQSAPFIDIMRTVGLAISASGLIRQVRAVFGSENQPESVPRIAAGSEAASLPPTASLKSHPFFVGWIVFFSGVPFIYAAWLPLLAIPGIIVGIKWQINRTADVPLAIESAQPTN